MVLPARLGKRRGEKRGERTAVLSIVIPTLNAADTLGATLAALDGGDASTPNVPAREILVVDGGSNDGTPALAETLGARVVAGPLGRGRQLIAGAEAAKGDWLLFLHADTRLEPGWAGVAAAFMDDPANAERAGYFRFALDDPAPAARRVERLVAWRCRRLGLPYGDQGLLIARSFYEALGGYRPLAMMEDVALIRRIGRRRLVPLEATALTSARRYERDGYIARPARNLLCLGLYFLGLPPRLIARLYA
jgi:rSAM/selenodomain-associated transferase 2